MTDPERSASDEARPDFDALFAFLLPHAEDLLKKHGEFYPFGAQVRATGNLELAAGYTGSEHPSADDVISLLRLGFAEDARTKTIRAVAICYDGRISAEGSGKQDAVIVKLEHVVGDAVTVAVPYRKKWLGGIALGEPTAMPGVRQVFV